MTSANGSLDQVTIIAQMKRNLLLATVLGFCCVLPGLYAQQPNSPVASPGTGANPPQSTQSESASAQAVIYVYRVGSMVGAAGYDRIYINDDYGGALHNSNYIKREVPAGTVVFTCLPRANVVVEAPLAAITNAQKKKYEKLRIEVEAGKTYYVKWHVSGSGGKMNLVDDKTGEKEVHKLHPAKD